MLPFFPMFIESNMRLLLVSMSTSLFVSVRRVLSFKSILVFSLGHRRIMYAHISHGPLVVGGNRLLGGNSMMCVRGFPPTINEWFFLFCTHEEFPPTHCWQCTEEEKHSVRRKIKSGLIWFNSHKSS